MKKGDLILSIICILLGILTLVYSSSFPGQAADFPRLLSMVLVALGGLLLGRTYTSFKNKKSKSIEKMDFKNIKKVGLIALLFIIYYMVLETLGYIIPTFLITFLTIFVLKYKKLKTNLILSAILSVSLYLIFTFLFQVKLPHGLFY